MTRNSPLLTLRREDLTLLLRRAKIVLNLHYYPAKVLEICRIVEAISFGAMVHAADQPLHCCNAVFDSEKLGTHSRQWSAMTPLHMQFGWKQLFKWNAARQVDTELRMLCMQVISEPGVDAALDREWEDKVVFAEGVEEIARQLRLYRCAGCLATACVLVPPCHVMHT